MNARIVIAGFIGVLLGAGATFLAMRNIGSEQETVEEANPKGAGETEQPPSAPSAEDGDLLLSISGKWVSADGQQAAELDYRILRFGETVDWLDLAHKFFLIGKEMRFMTNSGYYSINTLSSEPDTMTIIKQDIETGHHSSFTLYREGSPRARSRKPLVAALPPAKVQRLLDAIPSIKAGERKDTVMKRLGLDDDKSLEMLEGERSMGDSATIFSLGIDNEWMLLLDFSVSSPEADDSEAEIRRFQVVRGYVDDVREGRMDVIKYVYPYFTDGYIVESPHSAEPTAAGQPATRPLSK